MDRDRDRDRRAPDIPPEDQYGTGRGQSYRPGGARERTPPPRADTYRARSPPRRSDFGDSYRGSRPRSRTPPRRDEFRRRSPSPQRPREREVRGDSYRGRPRSPPRREDLPRDDLFRKEPSRDARDFREERSHRDERDYGREDRDRGYVAPSARSPPRYRDRSPVPLKRGREASPVGSRDRRSPPPAKRERLDTPPRGRYDDYPSRAESPPRRRYSPEPRERRQSPRSATRDYRQRSRSPPVRNERPDPRPSDDYRRPRSPSPRYAKNDYYSAEENGGSHSVATSRRSSPPVHPSRFQQVDDRARRLTPRESYDVRDSLRNRSPEPRRVASPQPRERDYSEERDYTSADDRIPPPREPYRADDQPATRAPPTGPAGYRAPSISMAPPTGPSAATVSISAHARAPAIPPSGPRAAAAPVRGDFGTPRGRGGFRGDFGGRGGFGGPSFRGGRGGATIGPGYGRGGATTGSPSFSRSESFDREPEGTGTPTGPGPGAPPLGPRNSFSQAPPPAFRQSNNTTATTYPRTQRFAPNGQPIPEATTPTGPRSGRRPTEPTIERERGPHPAVADLPKPIEGGQKMEPLFDRTKMEKLQEEAEKLRRIIDEKEAKKRKGLREWDRLSRETEAAAFRSQVAEEALRNASGEAESTAAF